MKSDFRYMTSAATPNQAGSCAAMHHKPVMAC